MTIIPESLIESADVGVVEFTESGTIQRATPLALRWLGVPSVAALPRTRLHPIMMECVFEAHGLDRPTIATIPSPSGDRLLLAAARVTPGTAESRVMCLLRQVPPSMSPGTIPEELELLRIMVEAAEDGLSIASGKGILLYVNSRGAQLDGVERDEVIGRSIRDLVKAGYFDRSATLEVLHRRTEVTMVETAIRTGKRLLVTGKPIFAPDGSIKYVALTDRDITQLTQVLANLQETKQLSDRYRSELRMLEMREIQAGAVVVRSAKMRAVHELAMRCATVDSPVLILGETGTGKGLFAKLIHQASERSEGPFIEVNCGSIPETLMEAELFGYVKGAFTGADPKGKVGLIELAHRGTLLLNEIGELPLGLQVKLLRFLEDGEIQPIGGVIRKQLDVRIIAATHRNLNDMIAEGIFRQDLFYRLNVLTVTIPPLREHPEDIPWLVDMMLSQLELKLRKRRKITPAALKLISECPLPGNVRQLWNLIERIAVTTDSDPIDAKDLPVEIARVHTFSPSTPPTKGETLRELLQDFERDILKGTLQRYKTQALAAKHLGLSQATISRKLTRYKVGSAGVALRRCPADVERGAPSGLLSVGGANAPSAASRSPCSGHL